MFFRHAENISYDFSWSNIFLAITQMCNIVPDMETQTDPIVPSPVQPEVIKTRLQKLIARRLRDLTQIELAKACGTDQSTISQLLNGSRRNVVSKTMSQMARGLKVSSATMMAIFNESSGRTYIVAGKRKYRRKPLD